MSKWEARGQELVARLRDVTDNAVIESLAKAVVDEIIEAYPVVSSRKTPLNDVRKVCKAAFPDTDKQKSDNQYFTNSGKGSIPRYQHLVLKFLSLPKDDWDALGDDSRREYQQSTPEATPEPEPKIQPITIKDLQIEQLELDAETQQTVLDALEHSGKSLAEFIQQACKVYAKTVVGKSKKYDSDDLANVPTSALMDNTNKEYKTHPKKIEELTRRAIFAIEMYNDEIATDQSQRWFISATAINALTGCRVQSVNEVMKKSEENVKTHNTKHDLTAYTNRGNGRKIEDDINFTGLVPDGLNL